MMIWANPTTCVAAFGLAPAGMTGTVNCVSPALTHPLAIARTVLVSPFVSPITAPGVSVSVRPPPHVPPAQHAAGMCAMMTLDDAADR